jgi:hypothetical protein
MARIDLTPEATVAMKIEVLDPVGKTVFSAGADPGRSCRSRISPRPQPLVRVR